MHLGVVRGYCLQTTLVFSPLAALVERNLYGDTTGRRVLPEIVSVDQRERGKKRRPA